MQQQKLEDVHSSDDAAKRIWAHLLIASCAIVLSGYMLCTTDQILWGHGYGMDGWIYGEMTEKLWEKIEEQAIGKYFFNRIAPCIATNGILYAFNLPPKRENIIWGFRIGNALLCILGTIIWIRVSDRFKLKPDTIVAGWMTLFASFFTGRLLAYYPVLTDGYATVLGLMMVWLSTSRRVGSLFLVSIFSGFTWPHAHFFGATLILLTTVQVTQQVDKPTKLLGFPKKLSLLLTLVAAAIIAGTFIRCGFSPEARILGIRMGTVRRICAHAPNLLVFGYAIFSIIREATFIRYEGRFVRRESIAGLILAAALILIHRLIVTRWANPEIPPPKVDPILSTLALGAGGDGQIFGTIATHIWMAGPLCIFAACCWRQIVAATGKMDLPMNLGLLLTITAWLQPETRYAMICLPFAVVAACKGMSTIRVTWHVRYCFLLSWCYFSGFWRTINPAEVIDGTFQIFDNTVPAEWNAAAFEMLRIIGTHRGFTWPDYFWHLGTSAAATAAAWISLKHANANH
jgi:hypothetical protein